MHAQLPIVGHNQWNLICISYIMATCVSKYRSHLGPDSKWIRCHTRIGHFIVEIRQGEDQHISSMGFRVLTRRYQYIQSANFPINEAWRDSKFFQSATKMSFFSIKESWWKECLKIRHLGLFVFSSILHFYVLYKKKWMTSGDDFQAHIYVFPQQLLLRRDLAGSVDDII